MGLIATLAAGSPFQGYRAETVESDGRAHNPLINSGVLCVMQLLHAHGSTVADVVEFVHALHGPVAGSGSIQVNGAAYQATLADSAHNLAFCRQLGRQGCGAFPDSDDAAATATDWYSQLDCLEIDCAAFARVAATVANGGRVVGRVAGAACSTAAAAGAGGGGAVCEGCERWVKAHVLGGSSVPPVMEPGHAEELLATMVRTNGV